MNREELAELHFITTIGNVPSILQHGILSHHHASGVRHETIAMREIQDRRRMRAVPRGRALHEYANLYINGRNKMMYKVKADRGDADLTVLRVSDSVLDLPGVVIADQNASSDYVRFAGSPGGLALIDRDIVFAKYWTHRDDPIEEMRHGSLICAEVLVPDCVEPRYIVGAYVPDVTSRASLQRVAPRLFVSVCGDIFFR